MNALAGPIIGAPDRKEDLMEGSLPSNACAEPNTENSIGALVLLECDDTSSFVSAQHAMSSTDFFERKSTNTSTSCDLTDISRSVTEDLAELGPSRKRNIGCKGQKQRGSRDLSATTSGLAVLGSPTCDGKNASSSKDGNSASSSKDVNSASSSKDNFSNSSCSNLLFAKNSENTIPPSLCTIAREAFSTDPAADPSNRNLSKDNGTSLRRQSSKDWPLTPGGHASTDVRRKVSKGRGISSVPVSGRDANYFRRARSSEHRTHSKERIVTPESKERTDFFQERIVTPGRSRTDSKERIVTPGRTRTDSKERIVTPGRACIFNTQDSKVSLNEARRSSAPITFEPSNLGVSIRKSIGSTKIKL